MSKPSLRLQFTKLLVFYHVLLWQLGHWPQSKLHCRADVARLPDDEVTALSVFMSNLELRPEQIIGTTYCSDVVCTYGFVIECHCNNESVCRITGIRMSYLGLTGTIHEKVGDLTSLTYLILSNNTLHGGIPDTIGNLKNLKVLDLSRNQLNDSIPASLGSMVSLQWLYLQYNLLSGDIPPSFGSLANLIELNLQFNMLSGSIPKDFGNLLRLKIMDLSENQLSGALPDNLRNLKYLTTLYVSANNLSGKFPETYGNLTSLKKFSIAGNYISGPLPVETIAKWTNITHLVLVGNNFEGNLTEKIFRLQKLQYLLISDLANDDFQLPPNISNSANFISLTLRNCSITGPIPKYIGEEMTSLRYLDLSFNKLTGGLPQTMSSNMIEMSFSGNMLDGTIPPWIHVYSQTRIDLSFNNFSAIGSPVPSNQQLNWFACCRNSSTNQPVMMENRYCPENNPKYHSLFINCGGEETPVDGNKYDQDNDTSLFYTSPKENWAYSLSGGYGVRESNTSNYIKSMTGVPISGGYEAPLYEKARLSPVSLKYYAFCLRKGNYTVKLYFNEVVYTKNEDYTSLRKRVFDVYIQDVRRLNYVNIREKNGSEPITENISAVVVNDSGLLSIHFYWPGKGSDQYPPSFNGPLISAISVTPEFKISSDKNNGQRVALITLASIVAALPLSLAYARWMGWLSSEGVAPKIEPCQEKKGDEHQDSEEHTKIDQEGKGEPPQKKGDEHQDSEEHTKTDQEGEGEPPGQEEIGDEHSNTKGQEEIGDEQRHSKDQRRWKNTETKRKKNEKIGDAHLDTVQKLGMFALSEGFPMGMSSEELPEIDQEGKGEPPGQEEIGDEHSNTKGQEEIGDEQRHSKNQGRRKNTETKRKKNEKIGDEHLDTVQKLGMFGLSEGFPMVMSSEELPSQEEIGDEHQDIEELPKIDQEGEGEPPEIDQEGDGEPPGQEEIGDEHSNTKGQEEIGDEQRHSKDQGRRKNTETKRKKNEKIGDKHLDTVQKLGMFGLSEGFPMGMSSEELPSDEEQDIEELPKIDQEGEGEPPEIDQQGEGEPPGQEEIGDEHSNTKGQEEIGDEQRHSKDQGRRKNTETKRKKNEKIGDDNLETVQKLGMFGLSEGFPMGMSSEDLPSQEEIGDEHQDIEELPKIDQEGEGEPSEIDQEGEGEPPGQEEIGDEHSNTKGQEEIRDEQRNSKDQGRRKNTKTKRKKNKKIGDEHLDTVQKLGMFGLSEGFPMGMSSEDLPSQEEIGDEHQDIKELPKIDQDGEGEPPEIDQEGEGEPPSQEEIGDEHSNTTGQQEIGDDQRHSKDQGRRKNTESKRKKNKKIGDEHLDTVQKLGMFRLSEGFPMGMSSEELPKIDQESEGEPPEIDEEGEREPPGQEEIGDEHSNTKGQEEIGDEQRHLKDQGRLKNTETKRKKNVKIGDEHLDTVQNLGMFGLSEGFPMGMSSKELPSDEDQDSEELPSQEEIGDEHQDNEELPGQEEIGDEQRNTKDQGKRKNTETKWKNQEEIGDEHQYNEELPSQEEIGDEQRHTKDQGRWKNTETKRKKKEKIGDEHLDTVQKLGMFGLSEGFPLGMSSEELPSQEEIGDEHQDSEELPSQEEIGDEQRNTKGQEEIGEDERNTKDQGMRKNTETKRKKKEKIGDEHPNTVKKLGMFGLRHGFPLGMSSEELPGQEEIGDEHQDNKELPCQEEIGDEHQDSVELPSQEEIGDEQRNTKGQEEMGDEQRNTEDQGRRKNTKTKREKKEKIGDEQPDTVKKYGMLGLSYGFPLGMSSEELPSQEEIGDEHQDSEEFPSQEEIGDEQRNTKDQGRRKNTETKRKKKEIIGDEHPDTVKKYGMLGLSYGFPLGMSSEELPSQEEIGDEHHDSEELPSQEEIGDEQRNTKGQEEIGDEQRNTKDQGKRKNIETRRKKKEKIGDEHPDTIKELINATENFSDKKKLGHSETFFMAQLPSHTVAVKKLDSAHFKGKIDKLKEEIGIIESLQHNNILKLLHAYIGKDLQFLVYEYMENKSLEDILFGSSTSGTIKLDWNTRVNICLGIAQGLQYLHERVQIVHTNIKSANILLNEKLEAKISDFGFANLYSEEDKVMAIARETKKGYTAPEYLQMDDLDSKLDVFSFGVVVLEIVSGERNVRNQSKKETEVLLDRAYKANRNGNLKSLVDKNLSTYDEREALIILKLALECTTMGASVRPEMSGVVSVLLGEKSIDEVCSPAKPTGDINVVGSLEELAGISDMAAKPTGDINVVGSLEESAGISDMAESLSPLWGS